MLCRTSHGERNLLENVVFFSERHCARRHDEHRNYFNREKPERLKRFHFIRVRRFPSIEFRRVQRSNRPNRRPVAVETNDNSFFPRERSDAERLR